MTSTAFRPRCLVCDLPTIPDALFDGWCFGCAGKALAALLFLRDGSVEVIGARVAWCRDAGVPFLATVICGRIPFETRPTRAELRRLTDG